jgi:trehalose synthase
MAESEDSPARRKGSRRASDSIRPELRRHRHAWLDDYVPLIGDEEVERISRKVDAIAGLEVQFINSTKQGGGVAEIMRSLVPLMSGVGIRTRWTSIIGPPSFYDVTKKIHNLLQGLDGELGVGEKGLYEETVADNAAVIDRKSDFIVVHDPQPLPLIRERHGQRRWIWRCHLDLSTPNSTVRDYLVPMINGYDGTVFSLPEYALRAGPPEHFIVPAIDPFTIKNRVQDEHDCRDRLQKYGIPVDLPIVAQISRFDSWKDPDGVIEAGRIAQRELPFTLVLLGNIASDDPEGMRTYERLRGESDERTVILDGGDDQLLVNALQTVAAVVVQKSKREGFGLTVTEAMWKGRPVVAGKVGGIKAQIDDGVHGFLVSSTEETAERIVRILQDPDLGVELGENAQERVRREFLLTRLLEQYLDLFTRH